MAEELWDLKTVVFDEVETNSVRPIDHALQFGNITLGLELLLCDAKYDRIGDAFFLCHEQSDQGQHLCQVLEVSSEFISGIPALNNSEDIRPESWILEAGREKSTRKAR